MDSTIKKEIICLSGGNTYHAAIVPYRTVWMWSCDDGNAHSFEYGDHKELEEVLGRCQVNHGHGDIIRVDGAKVALINPTFRGNTLRCYEVER